MGMCKSFMGRKVTANFFGGIYRGIPSWHHDKIPLKRLLTMLFYGPQLHHNKNRYDFKKTLTLDNQGLRFFNLYSFQVQEI